MPRILKLFLILFLIPTYLISQNDIFENWKNSSLIHKVEFLKKNANNKKEYLIYFKQPLNHDRVEDGFFYQRLWLTYSSPDLPTILVTEGYMAEKNYETELMSFFPSNQIIVEHRYFGESIPADSLNCKYLTIEQSANDHEKIIQEFKKIFQGKWITTGISKGGQMALIHRALFPNSVDLTVTYVAPFNLEREDVRLIDFFKTVGSEIERKAVLNFQKELLKRKKVMLPLLEKHLKSQKLEFDISYEEVFELSVLEYSFSAWQWDFKIENIDFELMSNDRLFQKFAKEMDFSYFSNYSNKLFLPFFYQAYTELGYYGYETGNLKNYLYYHNKDTVSSDFFLKKFNHEIEFDKNKSNFILEEFIKNNPATIHIVGAKDPWSATSPNVEMLSNSLKIVDENGSHFTRIKNLPDSLKTNVLSFIDVVLEIER